MAFLDNSQYKALLQELIDGFPDWDKLSGRSFLISGASGMIASVLIDAILLRNEALPSARRCRVLATSRSEEAARQRFARWWDAEEFVFLPHDITQPLPSLPLEPELVIHAASTTHPAQYTGEPINTILSNILGTRHMLDVTARTPGARFLLLSSVEIYGENRGDVDYFDERYCGYLDCNTLRAGYPEAKRVSESLCQAYIKERDMDCVILRLPRCYGPTMKMSDTKALSQFIKKGLAGEDIVLKSEGKQFFSYAFVSDAVLGMLYALSRGELGQAYNLADAGSDITLRELAAAVAGEAGRQVIFQLPSEAERAGYSTATRAVMTDDKLKALGWAARYDIHAGIKLTMEMLRDGV